MPKTFVYKFDAMSTHCELIMFGDDKTRCDKIAQLILLETKRLEKKYSYYDPASYLSMLNTRAISKLDFETKSLLQRALQYYAKTSKTFDITVATIKDLYTRYTSLALLAQERARLLPFVGCDHLQIKKESLYFDNPYTKIDLGGFVKEYAVDQAVKLLRRHKFSSALVNFGGDIFALGTRPDGTPFNVAIKDPDNRDQLIAAVSLSDQALTTSASYERNYQIEDQNFSHIIAPTLSASKAKSISVISHNCVESGVYSTALMINADLDCPHKIIHF